MAHNLQAPRRRQPLFFWVLLVFSLATLGAGFWQLQAQRQRIAEQSRPVASGPSQSRAPDFALKTSDGTDIRLSDLRGKVVLLNFWATWCPPCKAEMPDLDALYREYGSAHDFVVLGVDMEENAQEVRDFASRGHISFPLLLDDNGLVSAQLYAVRSLPTSMIIDREGRIRDAWIGQIAKKAMLARLSAVW
jgi:cytochrome c biogenesis protein CcmG, thiol:disulfide interchange protein DsbE